MMILRIVMLVIMIMVMTMTMTVMMVTMMNDHPKMLIVVIMTTKK